MPADATTNASALREVAREFLNREDALCFIGHERAPAGAGNGAETRPAVIRDPAQVDRLVWDRRCYANPVATLPRYREREGVVGIAVKGCDARALRELVRAGQIERQRLMVVGLPCSGLEGPDGSLAQRCHGCRYPEGFSYDLTLGPMEAPDLPPIAGSDHLSSLSPSFEERRRFWEAELAKCIRCDACRKICYACYCPQCIFEASRPRWVSRRGSLSEKLFFHAVRAFHLAGRCIGCDECARACPTGVRLDLLNRSLAGHLEQVFSFAGTGITEQEPPLLTFSLDDPELEPPEGPDS
jgi:formate dehydrogenase subunit beta